MRAINRSFGRYLCVAVMVAGCVVAIAACGSSGSDSTRASARGSSFLAFSKCMRTHGVPDFPDPSGGGGIHIPAGSSFNPFSPTTRAAQSQCNKLLPGGGPPPGVTEQQKRQLVKTSECMRAHGVTGFPDPTTTPPSSPSDYAFVDGIGGPNGGLFLLVPKTIDVASPVFKQAAQACDLG